jgi:hypothetical protein
MVDVSAIVGAVQALKSAGEMAQAMIGIRDAQAFTDKAVEITRKVVEAQGHATAAYAAHLECANRIGELERELMEMKDWKREAKRYELKEMQPGVFAYSLKAKMERGEPVHCICPACFQKREKSILQTVPGGWGAINLACTVCGLQITVGHDPIR